MGTEFSVQKNRNHAPFQSSVKHPYMNNLTPVVFHQIHGENVKLSRDGAVARRAEGFCKGIAFSNRPIMVNECIYVKFLEISSSWSGALRIGFTTCDPLSFRSGLPRYACPDLTNKPGNWAKAVAERFAKRDSILHYYVNENGDVHYGLDNEDKGIFFSGVNTSSQLWAMMDIYGNTVAVEFTDPRFQSTITTEEEIVSERVNSLPSLNLSGRDEVLQLREFGDVMFSPLVFHQLHGKNVTLSRNRSVASRKHGCYCQGYAFTERPLRVDEKIVIRILQTETLYEGCLIFGVTSCNPSNLNAEELPENADDLLDRPEYWIVRKVQEGYQQGDIIIYTINSEGQLQFSKNGNQLYTVMYVDHTLKLWAFIDLYGSTSEVWLVGTAEELPDLKANQNTSAEFSDSLTVLLPFLSEPDDMSEAGGTSHTLPSEVCSECVICYEEIVDCVLYRCGHMCMCYNCAMQLWKSEVGAQCPVCRKVIKDVIKTYR